MYETSQLKLGDSKTGFEDQKLKRSTIFEFLGCSTHFKYNSFLYSKQFSNVNY